MFTFVGGHPALDLVGTVGHRRTERLERLATPEALARWLVAAQLLDAEPATTAADLAAAVALREAIHTLATAVMHGDAPPAPAVATLNAAAAAPVTAVRLDPDGSVRRTGTPTAALAVVARAAIDLLGGDDAALIKECARDDCTRLFLDHSRQGNRRWCDMTVCGNRAKAAANRRRRSA